MLPQSTRGSVMSGGAAANVRGVGETAIRGTPKILAITSAKTNRPREEGVEVHCGADEGCVRPGVCFGSTWLEYGRAFNVDQRTRTGMGYAAEAGVRKFIVAISLLLRPFLRV